MCALRLADRLVAAAAPFMCVPAAATAAPVAQLWSLLGRPPALSVARRFCVLLRALQVAMSKCLVAAVHPVRRAM
jgi:hypothetical protein